MEGKNANNENGSAKPTPKPNIPITGARLMPWLLVCPINNPTRGPVQENDTIASVSAIKKIPINPPVPDFSSALFAQLLGSVNSKAPNKEMDNRMKMTKNNKFAIADVEIEYKIELPKSHVRSNVGTV